MTAAFQRPSPVLLSSSCVVVNGKTNVPDYTQLSYPFRKAILIDEVRFDLFCNSVDFTAQGVSGNPQLGALVYAKMQLGRHYLNRDDVPLWLFGTAMTQFEEGNIDSSLTTPFAYSHYRWKFASPVYIAAGQTLRSTFSRATQGLLNIPVTTTQDITVQVSYVGRVMPPNVPPPRTLIVPYVAPFVTDWGKTYQQSNEYNLFNPFDKPLRVQRMTGRVFSSVGAAAVQQVKRLTPATANGCIEVQIFDSWGGKLVNDLTGPSDIWSAVRSAWTFDTILPAKGQYDARVWNIPASQQMHIAIVGEREETL